MESKIYRVSAKALIFDQEGKLLMLKEPQGEWELPGGGIEHGEVPQETIVREVKEECGFEVESVASGPRFVWSSEKKSNGTWTMILGYETILKSENFVPSAEAVEYKYVSSSEMKELWLHPNIAKITELLGAEK